MRCQPDTPAETRDSRAAIFSSLPPPPRQGENSTVFIFAFRELLKSRKNCCPRKKCFESGKIRGEKYTAKETEILKEEKNREKRKGKLPFKWKLEID